ncbi:MAG: hypothetical protein ACD_4C00124G0002 [uncultured bacterium (gcode 4)]|uniref:Ribosomal RNA small subunit methyltransferase E n=1 Tax=uncultured bacterium (gcode 4) TaxID=1234023 RepID=K2FVB7_9BACT|nr:MAG: hypothetical protein ACD_4C00124G0002 [uncultured bacterium (gcode 4)]
MQRFYFDMILWKDLLIDDKDFFHQISHVLRSRIGDEIILFNWDSSEYVYSVSEINKKWINLELKSIYENNSDPKNILNLYQALPNKYEKIEYIIQKWVEIWISKFIFWNSERSQKLTINDKKIERFNYIIKESLEQCHWNKKPDLIFLDKINFSWVEWEKLVCHTKMTKYWESEFKDSHKEINLFVWPEWGFSDKEIEEFEKNWAQFINFWERVLRTETVWIVVGFSILNNWFDKLIF